MEQLKWWQKGVIYQIYPRSFASSGQKATGDLAGITQKLDYLQKLGIDAIWISPFFQSPMKDYGYDISDYKAVDPIFGKMEDFDRLISSAHKKNIRVIVDQVYNHTSDQHKWFQESKSSTENSKSDWYVWENAKKDGTPPNNWLSVFGGVAWTWNSKRRQYYLHQFLKEQPDLNFNNPEVIKELLETAKFWFDKGVDGFRLDTVNFYTQDKQLRDNPVLENPKEGRPQTDKSNPYFYQRHLYDRDFTANFPFLERLRELADKYQDKMYMGEIGDYDSLPILESYTQGNTRLHTAYTFALLEQPLKPDAIAKVIQEVQQTQAWPCWAFSNHDVVRSITRLGVSPEYYCDASKMLISLLGSLRGTPCLYQGEELGLPEAEIHFEELQDPYGKNMWPDMKGRDGCRTPIPWDDSLPNCGFSNEKPWLPIREEHQKLAVSKQLQEENSSLCFTQRFLHWRKTQELLYGLADIEVENIDNNFLVLLRKTDQETMRLVCNFSSEELTLKTSGEQVFSSNKNVVFDGNKLQLPAFGSCFLKI